MNVNGRTLILMGVALLLLISGIGPCLVLIAGHAKPKAIADDALRPEQTHQAPVRPPFTRIVVAEAPRFSADADEVRPERRLAILGGLPAGFVEGPLQGNTNAVRMAEFFHAGRGSDIEWAAFDAQEMTLYVIGARGAMEEMAARYPRILEAVEPRPE